MSCIGKVYRADVYNRVTASTVECSIKLRLRKKLSCPGCERCGWIDESLGAIDKPIINIEEAQHGRLYCIRACNESTDWETGIIDDYDLEIVEYEVAYDENNRRNTMT